MPELPEVETIKRQLSRTVLNKTICSVSIPDARVIKGISSRAFKSKVEGKKIKDIFRRGKVLVLKLEKTLYLIFHLRIAGWMTLSSDKERCARVIFGLSSGKKLCFCDSRVLGEVRLVSDWEKLPIIRAMGPEPWDISPARFVENCRSRSGRIKPLLMDQRFIAGIGNIYAQEALFCAGIDPGRKACTIAGERLEKLLYCLKKILRCALDKKGSTISTYRQVDGESGTMAEHFRVYQKKGRPCPRCGRIIRKTTIGGRGTCFCPGCQT